MDRLADTQRALIEAAERRGYERAQREAKDEAVGLLDLSAPEVIWLQVDTGASGDYRDDPFPSDIDGVTWHNEEIGGLEVRYIRADLAHPADTDALRAELAGLTAQYEERTAYTIVHRGQALACSDAMRGAYADEHHRAEKAEAKLAALRAMMAGLATKCANAVDANFEYMADTLDDVSVSLLRSLPAEAHTFTTGHCERHKQPGGCDLHNIYCGWPKCDQRPAQPTGEGAK